MSDLDEHLGYQRVPRRRLRRAGQGRRAGRRRSRRSVSIGASTAPGFPALAAKRGAGERAASRPGDIDHVAVSRDPKANLHKKILFAIQKRPSFTKLVKDRLANVAKVRGDRSDARRRRWAWSRAPLRAKFHGVEHHKSHISSAFFISPFEEAACLSIDGFGDFVSTMRGVGRDRELEIIDRIEFPHSAGLFYTAVTQFLGFHRYGEEWKMMGLAPYGKPTYVDKLRELIHPSTAARFELNLDYFRHHNEGIEMTWDDGSPQIGLVFSPKLAELLGPDARSGGSGLLRQVGRHRAQRAGGLRGDLLPRRSSDLQQRTGLDKLSLAGGCALNSVANGKLFERTAFRELFVQPGGRRRRHRDRRGVLRRARDPGTTAAVRHARRLHRVQATTTRRSPAPSSAPAATAGTPASTCGGWTTAIFIARWRRRSRPARWWAGSRGGWSSGRARWATDRSSPIRAAPT